MPSSCLTHAIPEGFENLLFNGCPSDDKWLSLVADRLPEGTQPTLLNVGANKGYRVPEWLALFTRRAVSNGAWHTGIRRFATEKGSGTLAWLSCGGGCSECKKKRPPPHRRNFSAHVHALELVPRNAELIQKVSEYAGVADAVSVLAAGVSNVTGQLTMPVTVETQRYGHEVAQLSGPTSAKRRRKTETVNVTTVDAFFASNERARSHIQHMTIDTEGWDPLVLEGSRQTLAERRLPTFSFEFIARGYWRNPTQRPCPRFLTRKTPQCDNGEILPESERLAIEGKANDP